MNDTLPNDASTQELLALSGLIETVTTVPTHTPTKFEQQVKVYVNSLTAPTLHILYIYSNKTNTWIPFTLAKHLLSGTGVDISSKVFYWTFSETGIQTAYWTTTLGGSGTNTHTLTDNFGYLITAVTATDSETAEYNTDATVQLGTFTEIVLEFEIRTTTNFTGDKVDMGIGMNPTAGQYPGFEAQSFGYIWNSASSAYEFVTRAGSATTDTGVTGLTTNTWHRLRFEIQGTTHPSGGTGKCFLDGVQIGTTHTTNIPSTTTQLAIRWIIGTLAGNATARNLQVRSVRLVMNP